MKRQSVLAIAGWCVAAVVAVAVGVTAVTLLGTGITSDSVEPVSQESAQRELDSDRAAQRTPPVSPGASAPSSSPSQEPAPPDGAQTNPDARKGPTKVLQSDGGSVAAYCAGDRAVLAWWTPAQGYSVDDVEPGPDDDVSVEFEHGENDVDMRITCAKGAPELLPDRKGD
ncbi:hypothetical protein CLV63_101269 [Murinocardiopsis flavida]|uniref:Septum formation initiator n=1 Tax=Murinocardiopsis flavida TaxID=645275 RepID=A0A2P8DUA4_9ACTN|nr:hypothetical protein [Murinocardiopsis flavida]PSL00793.1 hypothetical protein CLV63_101269 [Murinocardiopsis flavida]